MVGVTKNPVNRIPMVPGGTGCWITMGTRVGPGWSSSVSRLAAAASRSLGCMHEAVEPAHDHGEGGRGGRRAGWARDHSLVSAA